MLKQYIPQNCMKLASELCFVLLLLSLSHTFPESDTSKNAVVGEVKVVHSVTV